MTFRVNLPSFPALKAVHKFISGL